MKFVLFYTIPLLVYLIINIRVDNLSWPHFLLVLLSFLLFQMERLRFPAGAPLPFITKAANTAFYITTVAFALRDQFLNPSALNVLLGVTILLAATDLHQTKKEPSL